MEKKNIDWSNLGFAYVPTDKRFVANFKNGSWDEGALTEDSNIVMSECAGVLQYAQTVFEGMKAYPVSQILQSVLRCLHSRKINSLKQLSIL